MNINTSVEKEQPREKLLHQGAASLTDAELLAIFLRTGTRGKNVHVLSQELIQKYGGLKNLVAANYEECVSNTGVGMSKYVQLQASLELARRFLRQRLRKGEKIQGSSDTKDFLSMELGSEKVEIFSCMFLDNQHRLLDFQKLFRGTINTSHVHIREIIRQALLINSAAVIVAHNHPSGHCQPSSSDIRSTEKIRKAFDLMDIRFLDHCIVGDGQVYSFAENNHLG